MLDRWVMGWRGKKRKKGDRGFDEMSVKDGVIVRIDQALRHPPDLSR